MVPDTVKDDIQAIRDELTGGTLDVNIASGGTVAVTNSDITSIKTATELLDDTVFVDDADWTADTFEDDQYSLGKVTSVSSQSYTRFIVRYQPSGGAMVMVEKRYENTGFRIWWYNGSSWSQLGSTYSGGWSANDIIAIEVEGNDIRVYQNDNLRISATNASIPQNGYPGFGFADQADDSIDDWGGGNIGESVSTVVKDMIGGFIPFAR